MAEVTRILPVSGPSYRGSVVTVHGSGFLNKETLTCRFDDTIVPATWWSPAHMSCRAPGGPPRLMLFEVSNNAKDFTSSGLTYWRQPDASVHKIVPDRGLATGQTLVFVRGSNFVNTTALRCKFESLEVRATYISSRLVTCIAPSHIGGVLNITGKVPVEVSNNARDYTSSSVMYEYIQDCPENYYCPYLDIVPCPNGTYCPGRSPIAGSLWSYASKSEATRQNFTLCPPGTFQPKQAQSGCAPCPVGFMCPDFGLSAPRVCMAGFVCDSPGIIKPNTPCPKGHWCGEGTKTVNPADLILPGVSDAWESFEAFQESLKKSKSSSSPGGDDDDEDFVGGARGLFTADGRRRRVSNLWYVK